MENFHFDRCYRNCIGDSEDRSVYYSALGAQKRYFSTLEKGEEDIESNKGKTQSDWVSWTFLDTEINFLLQVCRILDEHW